MRVKSIVVNQGSSMNSRWIIPQTIEDTSINAVVNKFNISPTTAEVIIRRGYIDNDEIERFIHPSTKNLYDPFLMRDMEIAVDRIVRAVKNKEKILIYGDYDVDGISGTSLLVRLFRYIGIKTTYYIPHRRKEGYGLSLQGIRYANEHYVNLIITVDCGSGAIDAIGEALRNNIDVIVTDHHELIGEMPPNVPFLNPLSDDYPFKCLSGCGVAFKLAMAVVKRLGLSESELFWELDLVALSTVCDVVPLIGENRIFVKYGLRCVKKSKNKGIRALLRVSYLEGKDLNTYHLGFIIGPRINARGRLEDASLGVQLFITEDEDEALVIAKKLTIENQKRMDIEKKIVDEAELLAQDMSEEYGIVVVDKKWHPGVIGIAASRIAERFYRPTVIITVVDGIGKGSGRSIPEFHLYNALKECEDLFLSFGGHKFASGITINPANIDKFRQRFSIIAKRELEKEELIPKLKVDAVLSFEPLTSSLVKELNLLAPFGISNPYPIFLSNNVQVVGYPNLLKNKHLKFNLKDKNKIIKAIAFNNKELQTIISTGSYVDIVYQVKDNKYDNKYNIELHIKGIKLCDNKT